MRCGSVAALLIALSAHVLRAEPPRPQFANPTQVWWDASRSAFVVWQTGPNTFATIAVDGAVTRGDEPADLPANALSRAVSKVTGKVYWVEPGRPELRSKEGRADDTAERPHAVVFLEDGTSWILSDSLGSERQLARRFRFGVLNVSPGRKLEGVTNARGLAVSADGKLAVVAHLIPKSNLPSTQIEQGWVFTNAISLCSSSHDEPEIAIPLDLRTQGFANPEAVALSRDGKRAWVAHAGADVVSVVDLEKARTLVKAGDPLDLTKTRRYVRARVSVGVAPAGVALSGDETVLAVTNRLSDSVSLIDTKTYIVTRTVSLTDFPSDSVRRGERLFHSGKLSHTGQFSCASCHPDGGTDGLNWDLPADGFNNFYNTKSLRDLADTAPYGWLGTSPSLTERFQGTLRHLFQYEPSSEETADLEAYLDSLRVPGVTKITLPILDGPKIFESAGCAECHSGPKLTDRKSHDVLGAGQVFDTPSLKGVRDTQPYLHDGRAATLESIFQEHNQAGLHGRAADLTAQELKTLINYLKTR